MKKIFLIIAVAGFLTACNDANTNQTLTDTATTTDLDSANAMGTDTSGTGTGATLDTATTKPAGGTSDTASGAAH